MRNGFNSNFPKLNGSRDPLSPPDSDRRSRRVGRIFFFYDDVLPQSNFSLNIILCQTFFRT